MIQNETAAQVPYMAPTMTTYTEAELFAQMEAWGVSGRINVK